MGTTGKPVRGEDVFRFVLKHIETVPHLEALLLLWRSRPKRWSRDELAARLFVRAEASQEIAKDLVNRGLASEQDGLFFYTPETSENDRVIEALAEAYKEHLVPLSQLIHAKVSSAQEFARAFKFKKDGT